MTGRSHILTSGILAAALAARFDITPLVIVSSIIGGLFPDVDHRHSLLGRWIPLWLIFKPHRRNITHSLLGTILFSMIWIWFSLLHAGFFAIGYLTHLMMDACTKSGIPLWWPSKQHIRVAYIRTGGWMETIFVFLFYIVVMLIVSIL